MSGVSVKHRHLGSVYTPGVVTRWMVRRGLEVWLEQRWDGEMARDRLPRMRVLDPACGEGAFVCELLQTLAEWATAMHAGPLPVDLRSLFQDRVFGADLDCEAVQSLRQSLRERLWSAEVSERTVDAIIAAQVRWGDSLLGPDFHDSPQTESMRSESMQTDSPQTESTAYDDRQHPVIDWGRDFPAAREGGGFDLVVGNPPYVRELDAKELFDRIAHTSLGQRWRQSRMDLWYYFLHRGLDLLKPGGVLAFIVPGYWIAATSARRLIERLRQETVLHDIVWLDRAQVFAGVTGRHLILLLSKRQPPDHTAADPLCRVMRWPAEVPWDQALLAETVPIERLAELVREKATGSLSCETSPRHQRGTGCEPSSISSPELRAWVESLEQRDLFVEGQLVLSPPNRRGETQTGGEPTAGGTTAGGTTLGEQYDVRQGIAENPPAVTSRHVREFGAGRDWRIGDGVFVLSDEEVRQITEGWSEQERQLLRPYVEGRELGRYRLPARCSHQLLYATRETWPELERFPQVARHLGRFRVLMEQRRETKLGKVAWWQLHWPREERLFVQPRVLSLQMGARPQFVYAERPTFVGFAVNVIVAHGSASGHGSASTSRSGMTHGSAIETWSLPALAGLLNAEFAQRWFERYAKRRGKQLEINGHLLRRFPLPRYDAARDAALSQLVRSRQAMTGTVSGNEQIAACEAEIERQVTAAWE